MPKVTPKTLPDLPPLPGLTGNPAANPAHRPPSTAEIEALAAWARRAVLPFSRKARSRAFLDADDLAGIAVIAICAAAREWDGRGRFEAYARQKARWAVQEAVRSACWISRSRYRRLREGDLEPTPADLLPLSLDALLLGNYPNGGTPEKPQERIPDNRTQEPDEKAREREFLRAVRLEIEALPGDGRRQVARLILLEHCDRGEVSERLGVTREEVADMLRGAIRQLRLNLADWEGQL